MNITAVTNNAVNYETKKSAATADYITFDEYMNAKESGQPKMVSIVVDGVSIWYNMFSQDDKELTPELEAELREKYADAPANEVNRLSLLADLVNAGVISGGHMMMENMNVICRDNPNIGKLSVTAGTYQPLMAQLSDFSSWADYSDYLAEAIKKIKSIFNTSYKEEGWYTMKDDIDKREKLLSMINSIFDIEPAAIR